MTVLSVSVPRLRIICSLSPVALKANPKSVRRNQFSIKKTIANIPKEIESVISENNVIDLYQKDITLRGITANMNSEEQMKKYLEIMEIPEKEYDSYINTGMKIINLDLGDTS